MRIGFSLAGGGGKGGASAGTTYELHQKGITPDVIHGISVGALNGIMIALGQYEAMREIWHTVTDDDVRHEPGKLRYGFRFAVHKAGFGKPQIGYWMSEPLKKLVRKNIINKSLKCDFHCGVVEVGTDTFETFSLPKNFIIHSGNVDDIVDKIVASTAIPMIFEPVIIGGKMYVDGGVRHQMPLKPLTNQRDEIDYIIGVTHNYQNPKPQKTRVRDDLDMLKWLIDSLLAQAVRSDFDRFERINYMCKNGLTTDWNGKKRKYYPNTIFHPKQELSPSTRFHHFYGKDDFAHGREIAKDFSLENVHV